jgi:hypothetical protein
MKCPKCGLINPEAAQRCDCGHDFATHAVKRPTVFERLSKAYRAVGDFAHEGLPRLLFVIGIVAVAWWFGYTFWYAPSHKLEMPALGQLSAEALALDPRQSALNAILMKLAVFLPHASPRLEQMQGGNLDIYLSTKDYQEVPYPDRAEFIKEISETWCAGIDCSYLPAVQFRDIKTGEVLDHYGCCHLHWGQGGLFGLEFGSETNHNQ